MERYIRIIAGTFVLVSLALGTWVNHNWYWFTAFVGANLLLNAAMGWCPMSVVLHRLGVSTAAERALRSDA